MVTRVQVWEGRHRLRGPRNYDIRRLEFREI